jgi:hypothetical protein
MAAKTGREDSEGKILDALAEFVSVSLTIAALFCCSSLRIIKKRSLLSYAVG